VRLRVVTYNIHKCVGGLDRRCRPERVAHVLAASRADVAVLQEVVERGSPAAGGRQVDVLGEILRYRHRTFFPNVDLWNGASYGNAVLSRFPIHWAENIDLSVPFTTRRSGLHARFRIRRDGRGFRTLYVCNIHLGLTQWLRRRQLRRLLSHPPLSSLHPRAPVIIAGDFNDVWGTLGEQYLVPAGFRGVTDILRTFPAWAPVRALDGIYVRGDIRLVAVERLIVPQSRIASDHLPLLAELEID